MPGVDVHNVHQESVEEKDHCESLGFSLTTFHLTLQTTTPSQTNHQNVTL